MSTDRYIICPNCKKKTLKNRQFCQHCLYNIYYKSLNLTYRPGWVDTHKNLLPKPEKMDSQGEIKAVDVMMSEREKEMAVSDRAARWEHDRKREWAANKPYALGEK